MDVCVHPQGRGHTVIGGTADSVRFGEGHGERDFRPVEQWCIAWAVDEDREPRPCRGHGGRCTFGNVPHAERAFAAGLGRRQDNPMAVPQKPVIGRIAVVVFVKERRVVEVRMAGRGQSQDACAAFEPDNRRVQRGGPDIGQHGGTGEGAARVWLL